MSAFLVNKEHLDFIITWAIDNGTLGGLCPQAWFEEFYSENVRSLKHRYPTSYEELIYWDTKTSRYIPTFNAIRPNKYRQEIAIAVISFVNCWEYQSCEHDYDPDSLPWKMMAQIRNLAVIKAGYTGLYHEGHPVKDCSIYNKAPWEYDPKAWKTFVNYLQQENVQN